MILKSKPLINLITKITLYPILTQKKVSAENNSGDRKNNNEKQFSCVDPLISHYAALIYLDKITFPLHKGIVKEL